jgi:hypothetical protein
LFLLGFDSVYFKNQIGYKGTMENGDRQMTHSQMADRIIELANRLGYGLDIRFTMTPKPIKIKPLSGRAVSFSAFQDALSYLDGASNRINKF